MRNVTLQDNGTDKDRRRVERLPKFRHIPMPEWRNADGYSIYKHFMNNYGPKLVGHKRWEELRGEKTPEEWMTPYEEAFGLVTIENYEESIKKKVIYDQAVKPKWTRNGNAKRNQGYAAEGILRYRQILQIVLKGRSDDCSKNLGTRYKDEWKEAEREMAETGKRKRAEVIRSREDSVREILQISESGIATGFDGMKDFNILDMINKRKRNNEECL